MHRIRPRRFSLSRLLLICLCVLLLGLAAYAFFSNDEYGHMDITVVDAYSLQPVEGAALVFPDAGPFRHHGPGGQGPGFRPAHPAP